MEQSVDLNTLIQVIAVVLFVLVAVAVLLIVDSRARMRVGESTGRFGISGKRRDHPVWSWMVSLALWSVIGSLLIIGARGLVAKPEQNAEKTGALLGSLVKGQTLEKRRSFHNPGLNAMQGEKAVCHACHGDYPHSEKPMVRTLLNMHTQFLGCLTCHADPDRHPEEQLRFRWLNYSGIAVEGRPFGTDYDPATGGLASTDDLYSRIVVYRLDRGRETLLEIPASRSDAREFIAIRGQLSSAQLGAAKRMFHGDVKPVGRFCARCHAGEGKGFIPFRQLGFTRERVDALTNLNIIGIVEKYRDFHIPEISRPGLRGRPEHDVPAGEALIKEDPRAWWRGRYDAEPGRSSAEGE